MARWLKDAMSFAMFFAFLAVFAVKLRCVLHDSVTTAADPKDTPPLMRQIPALCLLASVVKLVRALIGYPMRWLESPRGGVL
jgi:hypothetical protein